MNDDVERVSLHHNIYTWHTQKLAVVDIQHIMLSKAHWALVKRGELVTLFLEGLCERH